MMIKFIQFYSVYQRSRSVLVMRIKHLLVFVIINVGFLYIPLASSRGTNGGIPCAGW